MQLPTSQPGILARFDPAAEFNTFSESRLLGKSHNFGAVGNLQYLNQELSHSQKQVLFT